MKPGLRMISTGSVLDSHRPLHCSAATSSISCICRVATPVRVHVSRSYSFQSPTHLRTMQLQYRAASGCPEC